MTDEPHALVTGEIRAVLARRRVTQVELARKLDVEVSWLKRRLNGITALSVDDMTKIAHALEVPVAQLTQPLDKRDAH